MCNRQPTKFATPDHQCFVEQTALLQILQQPGDREIGSVTSRLHVGRQTRMIVPDLSVDKELHKSNTSLDQTSSNQATSSVRIRCRLPDPVHRLRGLCLLRQVQSFMRRQLHASGQFVSGDASLQIRLGTMATLVQQIQSIEQITLHRRDFRRIIGFRLQIQHR